jgi:putative redox protein
MPNEMHIEAVWQGDWRFDAQTGTGHTVIMDAAVADGGTEAGPRPMELLIAGIAGCTGMDVVSILETMRQDVRSYRIKVTGARREDHPKVFTHIVIEHLIEGKVDEKRLARAIRLSNEKYCSAQAMVNGVAEIETRYTIVEG